MKPTDPAANAATKRERGKYYKRYRAGFSVVIDRSRIGSAFAASVRFFDRHYDGRHWPTCAAGFILGVLITRRNPTATWSDIVTSVALGSLVLWWIDIRQRRRRAAARWWIPAAEKWSKHERKLGYLDVAAMVDEVKRRSRQDA